MVTRGWFAVQPSRVPFWLALVAFGLAMATGSVYYSRYIQTVPALVAAADIPAGAPLSEGLVKVVRVPAGGTPPGALWGPGQVAGRYAAVPLFRDHILSHRHLSDQPDPLGKLTPGQRLMAVPVREGTLPAGLLRPGDTVDVAVAWQGPNGAPGPVEVLVAGVRVVEPGAPAVVSVNEEQARLLIRALEAKASLYFWLAERGL